MSFHPPKGVEPYIPPSLGTLGNYKDCHFLDIPCNAHNTAHDVKKAIDEAADVVDQATGGAWSSTRKGREEAAAQVTAAAEAAQKSVGDTVSALSQATQSAGKVLKGFTPKPMTAKQIAEFNRNPALYAVNVVTAPAAGWFVELMDRLVKRTGRKSLSIKPGMGSKAGKVINIDLQPRKSDSLIQTTIKLVGWISCCTYGLNEEVARKMFGFPVGKKGFLGTYDLQVPGQPLVRLPIGTPGEGFPLGTFDLQVPGQSLTSLPVGSSQFWTDGIGPTGVEETAAAGAAGLSAEALLVAAAPNIIGLLIDLIKCTIMPNDPACKKELAQNPQLQEALSVLPPSDFVQGSGDKERAEVSESSFIPIAVGGAVGVGLLLLFLYKSKKK